MISCSVQISRRKSLNRLYRVHDLEDFKFAPPGWLHHHHGNHLACVLGYTNLYYFSKGRATAPQGSITSSQLPLLSQPKVGLPRVSSAPVSNSMNSCTFLQAFQRYFGEGPGVPPRNPDCLGQLYYLRQPNHSVLQLPFCKRNIKQMDICTMLVPWFA